MINFRAFVSATDTSAAQAVCDQYLNVLSEFAAFEVKKITRYWKISGQYEIHLQNKFLTDDQGLSVFNDIKNMIGGKPYMPTEHEAIWSDESFSFGNS